MTPKELEGLVKACMSTDVEDDGLVFLASSIKGEAIRLLASYQGVRVSFSGKLGNAKVHLQIDVGFGDVITPQKVAFEYPSLLSMDTPKLHGYTPETAIAEKLEAMVVLDLGNSRLKDFYDIWFLSEHQSFKAKVLYQAIEATFRRRDTKLPLEPLVPIKMRHGQHGLLV